MDSCQHCNYSPGQFVLVWRYPDEGFTLAARLCWHCSEQVRLRHHRGLLVLVEDEDSDEWVRAQLRHRMNEQLAP